MIKKVKPEVHIHGKQSIVTSKNILGVFGKQHKTVLRLICEKTQRIEELGRNPRHYFVPRNYIGEDGKEHDSWELTRKGFDFLVLGFTGAKADEYKLEYIDKFHHNQNILIQQKINYAMPEWREERTFGKQSRRSFTDSIKLLQGYAKARGSNGYNHLYTNYTAMIYKALFTWDSDYKFNRDDCTMQQIDDIQTAEGYCADVIKRGMLDDMDYKVIYQKCKLAIGEVADVIGISEVPANPLGLDYENTKL